MTTVNYRSKTTADELYHLAKLAYGGSPWSKQIFTHDLLNKWVSYLIIEIDGEAIGFVGGTLIVDELSISNVAIIPAFQGQHLAEQLLLEWFDHFPAKTRAMLEVRHGNKRAHHLYERIGFEIYNIREDYYSKPKEDAYLMDLYLPLRK